MSRTAQELHAQFSAFSKTSGFAPVMEIMFDMSATVHAIIAADKSKSMSDFMDAIEGSRGLFNMLLAWTEEFHVAFETSDSQEDYIPRVDEFARQKFSAEYNAALWKFFGDQLRMPTPSNIGTVGIQMLPVVENDGDVTAQFSGPDDKTSYWSVYRRLADGTAMWELDAATQEHAEIIGEALCERYQVECEPYSWTKEITNVQA